MSLLVRKIGGKFYRKGKKIVVGENDGENELEHKKVSPKLKKIN